VPHRRAPAQAGTTRRPTGCALISSPAPEREASGAGLLSNQRVNQIVVLTAIMALAAVLRFAALPQRGLIYWDEAKFALEGERFQAYLQAILGAHISLNIGKSVGTAKPTHALFIALAYFIFGIHAYTPLFMDAVCSVVEVGVVFLVGRRLFGPWVGLLAALFLAVSEYDIIYARSALSESDADLLFLAGFFFWVIDWERVAPAVSGRTVRSTKMLVIAALLGGAAFTANYRLVLYIIPLVVFDIVWAARELGRRPAMLRAAIWIGGLAAVPLLWELIDLIGRLTGHVLFRSEVNVLVKSGTQVIFKNVQKGGPEAYIVQALFQLHGGKQSVFHFNPTIYLQWFVLRQGWVIPVLVLIGLGFMLRTRLFPWLAVGCLVVVPYLVYIFAPFIVPRNLSAAIPFVCLLAAAGLVTLAEKIPSDAARRATIIVAGCAIAAYGAWLAWPVTGERSGFAAAAAYAGSHGGKAMASNEIMVFYLPGSPTTTTCNAPIVPNNLPQLAAAVQAGYRYVEIESNVSSGLSGYIISHARLIGRWPAYGRITIRENPIKTENGDPPRSGPLEYVELYDLSGLSLPPAAARPLACYRNVPI
jgi:4-amino-4-deoxy-L-arabinose transferase-like glycosyltransferase